MPKFNFKEAVRNVTKHKVERRQEEVKPLLISQSAQSKMYSTNNNKNDAEQTNRRFSSSGTLPRSPSNGSFGKTYNEDMPMIKIRAGDLPYTPPSPRDTPAVMEIDFDNTPFQFYSRSSGEWKSAFIQGLIIGTIVLLCPALLMFFIFIGTHTYSTRYKVNVKEEEIRKDFWTYMVLNLLTLTKDLILIAMVIQSYYKTDASSYIVGYSPIVFFWFLILFAFPLTVFYFADPSYEFGFDSNKKNLLKLYASYFLSAKTKRQQAQKVSDQDKYFEDRYEDIASIKTSNDEINFLLKSTAQHLLIASAVLSIITCIIHAIIPLFLQLIAYGQVKYTLKNITYATNMTYNSTFIHTKYETNLTKVENSTKHDMKMLVVIGISTVNSFIVSVLAAPYFIYVVLWKIAMLKEWRRFNATEMNASETLIGAGPQGIAMWWKIRQTLKFFSGSSSCMSVLIGKMASFVATGLIVCLSVIICLNSITVDEDFNRFSMIPLIIDSTLLYAALLLTGILTILKDREKKMSVWLLELKQINISYELGHLMNLEQEAVENEPGVKVKVRVMRGCLMLLQELTSTMENLERNTSSTTIILVGFVISTLLILPSTMMGMKFIFSTD